MGSRIAVRFLLVILPLLFTDIIAADFTASLSSIHGNIGQAVTLTLRLIDADPKENPDLTPLLKNFNISSQQKYSSTKILNGNKNTETNWSYILLPKSAGSVTIPKISIRTKQGLFSSNQLEMEVAASNKQLAQSNQDISLITEISKTNTYLREPVIYTIKIISDLPWSSTSIPDIASPGTITEIAVGWPKQYRQVYGTRYTTITEIRYYVTPIKEGKLEIPAPTLEGEIQSSRGIIGGFYDVQPFVIQAKPITLNVQAPPIATQDWLPLQDLVLQEEWEGLDKVKVGDNIIRKISIMARGGFSSQLPDIKKLQENDQLKVYVNHSSMTDDLDEASNTIFSTKREEFSLVPKDTGTIELPEIKISWWNLTTNRLEYATLPAKKIEVAANTSAAPVIIEDFSPNKISISLPWKSILFVMLGVLCTIIISFVISRMRAKYRSLSLQLPQDVHGLRLYITEYAVKYWSAPANISLQSLPDHLITHNFKFDLSIYFSLINSLNRRLYAEQEVSFKYLMAEWIKFRKTVHRQSHVQHKQNSVAKINPT